ncbi:hypothetical protein CFP56_008193 [Quercus suber]|uniref:Uncharacterized protein n=1 Tax=Quercus suber TaxID=58331 RepID=A0AAW0L3R6_QUESU
MAFEAKIGGERVGSMFVFGIDVYCLLIELGINEDMNYVTLILQALLNLYCSHSEMSMAVEVPYSKYHILDFEKVLKLWKYSEGSIGSFSRDPQVYLRLAVNPASWAMANTTKRVEKKRRIHFVYCILEVKKREREC